MGRHLTILTEKRVATSFKLKEPTLNIVTEEKLDNYFSVLDESSGEPIILDIEEEPTASGSRGTNNVNIHADEETLPDWSSPPHPLKIPDGNMPTVIFEEEPMASSSRATNNVNVAEEARRRRERMMLKLSEAKLHGLMNNIIYN